MMWDGGGGGGLDMEKESSKWSGRMDGNGGGRVKNGGGRRDGYGGGNR